MFTGLIQCVGEVCGRKMSGDAGKFQVRPSRRFDSLQSGESIAVNGVCLTLEKELSGGVLEFHVLQETFDRTNLGGLKTGSHVNLERALALGDRLGGHIVSGHIDGTGRIISLAKVGSDTELKVEIPPVLKDDMIPKGSIAIDGISLTIASLKDDFFTVRIIPTTWNETNLSGKKAGDTVNLEGDMIGKYVKSHLDRMFASGAASVSKKNIELADLEKAGFF